MVNQFSDLERCALRKGNVHSADGWKEVLAPIIARYKTRELMRFFRADAAFAIPELYEMLETEGYFYSIRLKGNAVLQEAISHLLKRPVGRPPNYVRRFYKANTRSTGRGYPASVSATTRSGCSFMRWPTTLVASYSVPICLKASRTGR